MAKNKTTKNKMAKNKMAKNKVTKNKVTKNKVTKNKMIKNKVTKNKTTKNEKLKNVVLKNEITINPWTSILFNPRKTIRAIVNYNSNYRLFVLAAIYGFTSLLGISQKIDIGNKLGIVLIIVPVIILASLWGYIVFSISSFFVFFSGLILKGKGSYKQIRAATAWANVPGIADIIIWVLFVGIFGLELFQGLNKQTIVSSPKMILLFSGIAVQIITSVWSLVIYVVGVAEVQMFSIFKSVLNIIIATLIVSAIIIVVFFATNWAFASFATNSISNISKLF